MRAFVLLVVALCILNNAFALPNVARCVTPDKLLYRTVDGECNNVLFPDWGRALEYYSNGPEGREAYPWQTVPQFPRGEVPTYAELDQLPSSGPRGNARDISNALCIREVDDIDPINHSMLSVMFGQFLNHDMENNQMVNASSRDHFPLVTYLIDRNDPQCPEATAPPAAFPHPDRCNDNDTILTSEARFTGGTRLPDGTFRARNNASAYLDLDLVYGRNSNFASILRTHSAGKLRLSNNWATLNVSGVITNFTLESMLPSHPETGLPVNPNFLALMDPSDHHLIVTAGDERVNENLALMFFHTLFAREHNKVCDELMEQNLLWKLLPNVFDELIYQRARAITISKYQRVVYEDYFPNAIGPHFTNLLGNYQGYNPLIDTSTNLAFSGAAFRYGHFTIRNYQALDECGNAWFLGAPFPNPNQKLTFLGMSNSFPDFLTPLGGVASYGGFENIVRGLINERSSPNDLSVLDDIRNLALPPGVLDLITLDIARQRFNTLPNYQRIRKHYRNVDPVTDNIYGAPGCPAYLETSNADDPIECFEYITSDSVLANKLKNVYKKVNLIDAVIGVTSEDKVPGTSFGHTQGNLIVEQFKKYRDGDRFFYKNLINSGFFTTSEKNAILGTTMSTLIKRNFNVGEEIPANVFQAPDNYRQSLIDSCSA